MKSKIYLDRVAGLIKWDEFYFVDENFFNHEDLEGMNAMTFRVLQREDNSSLDDNLSHLVLLTVPSKTAGIFDEAPYIMTVEVSRKEPVYLSMANSFEENRGQVEELIKEIKDYEEYSKSIDGRKEQISQELEKIYKEYFYNE